MNRINECPQCGAENETGASECLACGYMLTKGKPNIPQTPQLDRSKVFKFLKSKEERRGEIEGKETLSGRTPTSQGEPLKVEESKDENQNLQEETALFNELLKKSTPRFFITPIIISINAIVFIVMVLSGVSLFEPTVEALVNWGANFGPYTINQQWWRLLSSTFLHIGIFHILFNMWCLWSLGFLAERMFGNLGFLTLYIFSGLIASMTGLFFNPTVVSAGASGAIFGIAGGLIIFLFMGKISVPETIIKKNLWSILSFVGYNLFYGFTSMGIDNGAHLGGFLSGMLLGLFLHRPLPPVEKHSHIKYSVALFGSILLLVLGSLFVQVESGVDYGKRLEFNEGELFYTSSVTETEATKLGEYLIKEGFFENQPISAQINKVDTTYEFRFVVQKGAESNNEVIFICREFANSISRDVFYGEPVSVHLCNEYFETLKIIYGQDKKRVEQEKILQPQISEAEEKAGKIGIAAIIVRTREEAQEILKQLNSGQKFGELARKHSIGPGRDRDGFIGFFALGDMMPELNKVAVKLQVGEYSGIIETSTGFFIIMKTGGMTP